MSHLIATWKKHIEDKEAKIKAIENDDALSNSQRETKMENIMVSVAKLKDKVENAERKANSQASKLNTDHEIEAIEKLAADFLDDTGLHYIWKSDAFCKKYPDGNWELYTPASVDRKYSVMTDKTFKSAVMFEMEQRGWKYDFVTYSFGVTDNYTLNLMSTDHWVNHTRIARNYPIGVLERS